MQISKCRTMDNLFQGDTVIVSGDMCRKMTYGDARHGLDFHVSMENATKGSLVKVAFSDDIFEVQE